MSTFSPTYDGPSGSSGTRVRIYRKFPIFGNLLNRLVRYPKPAGDKHVVHPRDCPLDIPQGFDPNPLRSEPITKRTSTAETNANHHIFNGNAESIMTQTQRPLIAPSSGHLISSSTNRPVAIARSPLDAMEYSSKYLGRVHVSTPFNNLSSVSLEVLMARSQPIDLSSQVTFEVDRPVDGGGFSEIRLGHWNGKNVAVKILKIRRDSPKATTERHLRREMEVWAALKHPNIVQFNGYITGIGEIPAMVSTWCEKGDAIKYLEASPHTMIQTRFRLAQDVADGLAYLHSLKIVHGDLKLRNILINDNGIAQLCDFGLVRLVDWQGQRGLTTTSPYGGTWKYNAYELFPSQNNRNVRPTFASDIYALGCVAYEFVYLKQPFHELEILDLVAAINGRKPPASRPRDLERNGSIFYLWDLLESCWNPDPQERPNAKDVVLGLNKIDGDILWI